MEDTFNEKSWDISRGQTSITVPASAKLFAEWQDIDKQRTKHPTPTQLSTVWTWLSPPIGVEPPACVRALRAV